MSDEQNIFSEALEKATPEERAQFLNDACGADEALRGRIEMLVAAHGQASGFLEASPIGIGLRREDSRRDLVGTMIGPYKLLEQIGEGGMGVVYMAEQTRPVRRRIALKIIKPGLDTRQVIARFDAERQALAMMDHPNIAKVFDAGATESGRSYFAMELVKGIPITEYCDAHQLNMRERLELFIQVCAAVQHAHQKGIIHRDLKPTNVLVTLTDDGRPVPKVIDFGIAKATTGRPLTDMTVFTQFRQLLGTPLYMSPEQAQMSTLEDVDTRSDVYSLGVLLYELLTGTTPFDKQRLAEAAYDEVRRILREEEPPRPSTRLSSMGETLTTISADRHTDPKKLGAFVRGELDWIVMRALEKDRTRRYETSNDLGRDIERYLTDQPVEACPPSRAYRFRKMVRRNKPAIATVATLVLVLVVASAVSTWQAVRATREKHKAEVAERKVAEERDQAQIEKQRADEQASIAKAVSEFVSYMIVTPLEMENPTEVTVAQATSAAVARLDSGALDGQPLNEAAVRTAVAQMLQRLGRIDQADENLRKALAIREKVLPPGHPDLADNLQGLAWLKHSARLYDQAEALMRRAVATFEQSLPANEWEYSYSLTGLAQILCTERKFNEAEQHARKALAIRRRILPAEDSSTAHALGVLADILDWQKHYDEAERAAFEAVQIYRNTFSPSKPWAFKGGSMLRLYAGILRHEGKLKEADAIGRELLEVSKGSLTEERRIILVSQANLLKLQGKFDEAAELMREALELKIKTLPPGHPEIGNAMAGLAVLYQAAKKSNDAQALCDTTVKKFLTDVHNNRKRGDTNDIALALIYGGTALQAAERIKEAEEQYREALAIRQKLYGEQSGPVNGVLLRIARMHQANGRGRDAEELWKQSVQLREQQLGSANAPQNHAAIYLDLIASMLEAGQVTLAQEYARKALELGARNGLLLNKVATYFAVPEGDRSNPSLAVRLAQRACDLVPREPGFRNTLGIAHYRAREYAAATTQLKQSIEFTKDNQQPSNYLFLAMACSKLGDPATARAWYDKAIALKIEATQNPELRGFLEEAKKSIGLPSSRPTTASITP